MKINKRNAPLFAVDENSAPVVSKLKKKKHVEIKVCGVSFSVI